MKFEEQIIAKTKEVAKEKGSDYAMATTVASFLGALILGSGSDKEFDEMLDGAIEKFKDFQKETIKDAIGIIALWDGDKSIYDSADIYFKEKQNDH